MDVPNYWKYSEGAIALAKNTQHKFILGSILNKVGELMEQGAAEVENLASVGFNKLKELFLSALKKAGLGIRDLAQAFWDWMKSNSDKVVKFLIDQFTPVGVIRKLKSNDPNDIVTELLDRGFGAFVGSIIGVGTIGNVFWPVVASMIIGSGLWGPIRDWLLKIFVEFQSTLKGNQQVTEEGAIVKEGDDIFIKKFQSSHAFALFDDIRLAETPVELKEIMARSEDLLQNGLITNEDMEDVIELVKDEMEQLPRGEDSNSLMVKKSKNPFSIRKYQFEMPDPTIDFPDRLQELVINDLDDAQQVLESEKAPRTKRQKAKDFVAQWVGDKLADLSERAAAKTIDLFGFQKARLAVDQNDKSVMIEMAKALVMEWAPFIGVAWILEYVGVPWYVTKLFSSVGWIAYMEALDRKVEQVEQERMEPAQA